MCPPNCKGCASWERKERAEEVNHLFASCTEAERVEIRITYRFYRKPVSSHHLEHNASFAETRKTGWATQARAEALYELQQVTLRPTTHLER